MALPALYAELAVVYILVAVTGYAVLGCFQLSSGSSRVTVMAAGFFMGAFYLETCFLVVIEQPVLPCIRVVTLLAVCAQSRLVDIVGFVTDFTFVISRAVN